MLLDALVYGVGKALAAAALQEREKGEFEHGWRADHHHRQGIVWVGQAEGRGQHRIVPADLRNLREKSRTGGVV